MNKKLTLTLIKNVFMKSVTTKAGLPYINPFIQVVSKAFSMSRKRTTVLSLLLKPVTMRSIILASYNDVLCEFQYPN